MELKYCEKCKDCSCLISSIFETTTEILEKNEETIISVRTFMEQESITNISTLIDVISQNINNLTYTEKETVVKKIDDTKQISSNIKNTNETIKNISVSIENNIIEINNNLNDLQNKTNNLLTSTIPDILYLNNFENKLNNLSNNLPYYDVLQTQHIITNYEELHEISIEISCLENYTHKLLGVKAQQYKYLSTDNNFDNNLWEETIPGNTGISYSILNYLSEQSENYISDNISVDIKIKHNENIEDTEKPPLRLVIYTVAKII